MRSILQMGRDPSYMGAVSSLFGVLDKGECLYHPGWEYVLSVGKFSHPGLAVVIFWRGRASGHETLKELLSSRGRVH